MKLPEGEDLNEWLALHTIDFFNHVNMLYSPLNQYCTKETCPTMTAGRYEYQWCDGVTYKKPTPMSAPEYIEQLILWIQNQLDDSSLFPTEPGKNGHSTRALMIMMMTD